MHLPWICALILLWLVVHTGALSNQLCPKHCSCNKSKLTMDCDGKHGVINYIPKPPGFVKYFQLKNTNLQQMTKATMANLTNSNVTHLHMLYNKITNINTDALSDLTNMEVMDWEQSSFPISEFCLALQHVQNLSRLSMIANNLDTETVWASSFQHLTGLQYLRLSLSEMRTFNTSGVRLMKELKDLDLSDNRLLDFSLADNDIVPNLTTLTLSQNNFDTVPVLCSNTYKPLLPKLSHFNLQDNIIRILDTSGLSCLKHLHKIILDQNRIKQLHNNSFVELVALETLHLSLATSLQFIDELAFNSSSLAEIELTQNSKMSLKSFNPALLFTHTHKLELLDMSNTKLLLQTKDLKALLLSLKNIKWLRLTKSAIFTLPSDVFCHLSKLKHLVLTGNNFEGWDKDVFAHVTSITHIFLDGNNIKIINESSFPLEFRLSVKQIDLANNPFSCTCDQLWFRNWMKEVISNNSILFIQYPERYKCRSPIYGLHLNAYNPTFESCTIHQPYFVYLVITLCLSIIFTVASLVTYRYRWYILYWISLVRRRRQKQYSFADMQYDGFISYSNPDWDWVSSELMDFLEGQVKLRLCEHSRDFKAGMYIVDNVIEAIDTSRKTILVISNEYMMSDWCQFELQMALSSFLKKENDIIFILLDHIKSNNVTSSLRALMVSTTYMEWSDDPEAKGFFQERLKNAMNVSN